LLQVFAEVSTPALQEAAAPQDVPDVAYLLAGQITEVPSQDSPGSQVAFVPGSRQAVPAAFFVQTPAVLQYPQGPVQGPSQQTLAVPAELGSQALLAHSLAVVQAAPKLFLSPQVPSDAQVAELGHAWGVPATHSPVPLQAFGVSVVPVQVEPQEVPFAALRHFPAPSHLPSNPQMVVPAEHASWATNPAETGRHRPAFPPVKSARQA
jgi:hypothetical protein